MGLRLGSVNRNYGSSESNIVLYFDELRNQASIAAPLAPESPPGLRVCKAASSRACLNRYHSD